MIQLQGIEKSFGSRVLFSDVNWRIKQGDRVGLVGENGAGKTTLLKILAGVDKAGAGEFSRKKGLTIGHLFQEMEDFADGPLLAETLGGRRDLRDLELEIERLTDKIHHATPDEAIALAHDLHDAQEKFEILGGYAVEAEAKGILRGMGFEESDFHKTLTGFSGGWRTRAQLARLLLAGPDILLLDEPTNHLDLESTVWLEGFLKAYKGSIVLISHDRYFMNRLTNAIAELELGKMTVYPYPYDKYVEEKAARAEILENKAARQEKEIARQEKFIERFRAKNTKATLVQSRIKALEKIERVEVMGRTRSIGFSFMEAGRIGKNVVELVDVRQGYGNKIVYDCLNFTLRRGERVALAGHNGSGKSTMIKILAGIVPILDGRIVMGQNVSMRHYAQHQMEALDINKTVLDEVTDNIPLDSIPLARTCLGAFLFRGDDVFKPIRLLSGGEKARVALAKLALTPTNLLLLDEPTNHLDIKSREALEDALVNYPGCIVMISHDRAFISSVANKIVHVENGLLTEYPGGYSYYEAKRAEPAVPPKKDETANAADGKQKSTQKDIRRESAKAREEIGARIGPMKKTLERLERDIAGCEEKIVQLEAALADPAVYTDPAKARDTAAQIAEAGEKNKKLTAEWERTAEKMETIKTGS
ncbi:MAG: ATP-binding cassette domain-containing protein [Nitrospinae bacterium]|nr:ATP-binding cassette domain-containing protein [Nitrospinota bacterium]